MNTERPDNDDAAAGTGGEASAENRTPEPKATPERETSPQPPEAETPAAPEPEAASRPQPDVSSGAQTAPRPETTAEPEAAAEPEAPPAPDPTPEAAANPAPEPGTTPEPRTASRTSAASEVAGDEVPRDGDVGVADDERPARRRSPAVIASVAAAVLLAGGGGAYLAATATGAPGGGAGSAASGGTPPPLALDGYPAGSQGIAPGEPNPYGVTYRAGGTLPDGPGSAPVYRSSAEVTKDEVARLAKALGLDGTPVAEGRTWRVGSGKDGSGPVLQVSKEAPGTWTFSRYAPGTDNCRKITVCTHDPAVPATDGVSEPAARKAAAPVLKAVGQDDAKVDASQVMGAQRVVNADPVVGGLPTYGWTTGLTVGKQGEVVGGHGRLKTPVKGDTYPVLDAGKTLALMNEAPGTGHRMGIGGCAAPVPQKDRLEQPCGSVSPTAAPTPARETVTVRKAVFGLAAHSVDGRQALVPSWLFQAGGTGDAFTVTYPAVDPKYLAAPGAASSTPSAAEQSVTVTGYSATDDDVTVTFEGGVCSDYKASAAEDSGKVTVKVTETRRTDKVCVMIAKVYHRTVHLDRPLGNRKLVGSNGRPIPEEGPEAHLDR
ncbi:hypothetical protein ABZX30_18790 [Streptomyces sp. NPDC004542]|uniref:hypothetical protein n=1 Tax=Streptomyces sp. NPDC004542 TaxID=3154281 RepID=UPI0033B78510